MLASDLFFWLQNWSILKGINMGKTLIRMLADSDATVALGAELALACHQSATIFCMVILVLVKQHYRVALCSR